MFAYLEMRSGLRLAAHTHGDKAGSLEEAPPPLLRHVSEGLATVGGGGGGMPPPCPPPPPGTQISWW